MRSPLRIPPLAAVLGAFLIPGFAFAQKETDARVIRLEEGISVRVAPLWQARSFSAGTTKLELTAADGPVLRMVVYFTVEKRRSASDALQRAAEIAGPPAPEDRLFLVDGWPAVEVTRTLDVPRTSRSKEDLEGERPAAGEVPTFERTMTAIAARDRILIVEQRLYDRSDQRLRDAGREVVGGVTFLLNGDEAVSRRNLGDITIVRKNLFDDKGVVGIPPGWWDFFLETRETTPVAVQTGWGEIAMAASYNGRKVAIVTNSGWGRSADFGVTYTGGNGFPASIPNQGDPALAYGGKTDNFYLGYLGRPNGGGGAGNTVNGCTASVDRSKDGQTYAFAGHAGFCAASATAGRLLCAPDQEQIAADSVRRRYRSTQPGSAPKDQVYLAWRQFTATATTAANTCAGIALGNPVVSLACSQDNGATWSAARTLAAGSDYGRVAVGPDGFVYVVYSVLQNDGAGGQWDQIYLDKFSSCKNGFGQQSGYPRTVVANARPASCGATMPGLDRCSGESMNSHTVTVSAFDPKGMVFVVYADGTVNGTDRVIAAIAPNGGFNVTSTRLLSDGSAGRKFLPWSCAEGRNLYATWFDRRAATTPATVDLTDFYAGWLRLENFGITERRNINLTGNSDPQCASGWPAGTQDLAMATSCPTAQPTAAAGRGAPKYGDYNACACADGRLFAAWTSATSPAGIAGATLGLTTFARTVQPTVP